MIPIAKKFRSRRNIYLILFILPIIIIFLIKSVNVYNILCKKSIISIPSSNAKSTIFHHANPVTILEAREGITNLIHNENHYLLEIAYGKYEEIHGFTTKKSKIHLSEENKKILMDGLFSDDYYLPHLPHNLKFRIQCDLYVKFSTHEVIYEIFVSDETKEVFIFTEGKGLRYCPAKELVGRKIIEKLTK